MRVLLVLRVLLLLLGDLLADVVHVEVPDRLNDPLSSGAGSAPGWENSRMPSRKTISVGIEAIPAEPDSSGWSSVSTLPNVMSECWSLAASNMGANIRQGPHQEAHQSTRVIPGRVTVSLNVSAVSATVLMFFSLLAGSPMPLGL